MGYWSINITQKSSKLVTTTMQGLGRFSYKKLPMGGMPSAFIFQENMDNLMRGLDHVLTYLDDILCVTKGDYTNHINKLGEFLKRLQDAGLK